MGAWHHLSDPRDRRNIIAVEDERQQGRRWQAFRVTASQWMEHMGWNVWAIAISFGQFAKDGGACGI